VTLVAEHLGASTSRAAIIDPPLGLVTIDLTSDDVSIRFSNGDTDTLPRAAVRAMERDDCEVSVNWAGTPILVAFGSSAESATMFDELGGFDLTERVFTIMVGPAGND
jgi:hypothetical protein